MDECLEIVVDIREAFNFAVVSRVKNLFCEGVAVAEVCCARVVDDTWSFGYVRIVSVVADE